MIPAASPPMHVYLFGHNRLRGTLIFQVNQPIELIAPHTSSIGRLEGVSERLVKLYRHQAETHIELRFDDFYQMARTYGRIGVVLSEGLVIPYSQTFLHRNLFDTVPMALTDFMQRVMPGEHILSAQRSW